MGGNTQTGRRKPASKYELRGLVRDAKTGKGLPGYRVAAYDVDPKKRDLLGRAVTLLNGEFVLYYTQAEFIKSVKEKTREGGPDIVVEVTNSFGKVVRTTDPLIDAGRFEQILIDIEVTREQQRPEGPPVIDPFKVLKDSYKTEIAALEKGGVKDRAALLEADLPALARKTRVPVKKLETFRLHSEMAHADRFGAGVAEAIVSKTGFRTREQLAIAQPRDIIKAITSAQEEGLVDKKVKITPSTVYGWIGYAKGIDPTPFASEMNMKQVLRDAKLVTDAVKKNNIEAIIVNVAGLLNPYNRLASMAGLRALMEDSGVTDLSSLGTFSIHGQRVIHPGYYVAFPPVSLITTLTDLDLVTATIAKGKRFKRVEAFADCLRFVPNPVTDAVIIGSVVDFVESDARLIIGRDVTSLTIITEQILYSQVNEITYEDANRTPDSRAPMNPARAATGSPYNDRNVYSPGDGDSGRNGGEGAAGQHGGAGVNGDTLGPAPDVTIYVQHTPEGLPDINIGGRRGGAAQAGQHGGNGSDGARGRHAKSGACQCWRSVGWGGNGGSGGPGGNGGPGGAGGSSGDLTIHTLDDNIPLLTTQRPFFVNINGGAGGNGGERGMGGAGGYGGAPGDDSWPWCDEEPGRVGANGSSGGSGAAGPNGANGQSGMFTLQPITQSDWNAIFNQPWITRLEPWYGNTGRTVRVVGRNLTDDTVVIFNGSVITPTTRNVSAGTLEFVVPTGIAGGLHSVVLRLMGTSGYVYSNTVSYRVTPHLVSVTPDNGVPGTPITLAGTGFAPGAQVRFAGTTYPATHNSNQELALTLPDHENIGTGAGTIDVQVVNPDGRESEILHFELTLDIIVRVKAWLVFPDIWVGGGGLFGGPGPDRDAGDVQEIFMQSPMPSEVWAGHHIVLQFDPAVGICHVPADWAESWPIDDTTETEIETIIKDTDALGNYLHYEEGAINFYFVDDIDDWTTHAYTYRGYENDRQEFVIWEDTPLLTDWEEAHVGAHELGHTFGLAHVCGTRGDELFGRDCISDDNHFLMHPTTSMFMDEGNTVSVEEARIARRVARPWHNL